MRSALLIAAALWAASGPAPGRLRLYFDAQLASAVVLESLLLFGSPMPIYSVMFALMAALILAAAFGIVWQALGESGIVTRWRALGATSILGMVFSGMTVLAIYKDSGHMTAYLWFPVVQSGLLTAAGVAMALSMWFLPLHEHLIAGTLSILWLCQAGFGYLLVLFSHSAEWQIANHWVPSVLVISALGWLGWKLRHARALVR
jgi:hypothetical protein